METKNYRDFLDGVGRSNWLRSSDLASKAASADEDEVVSDNGDAPVWGTARVTGVVVGLVFSITAFVVGVLLVAGVLVFSGVALAESLLLSTTLQIEPIAAAPHGPSAPPGATVYATSTCSLEIAGIQIERTNNGLCEDGGTGSISSDCEFGTDFPDCNIRSAPNPPPLPSVPPPLLPSPLAPGARVKIGTVLYFSLEEECASSPPSSPPPPPSSCPMLYFDVSGEKMFVSDSFPHGNALYFEFGDRPTAIVRSGGDRDSHFDSGKMFWNLDALEDYESVYADCCDVCASNSLAGAWLKSDGSPTENSCTSISVIDATSANGLLYCAFLHGSDLTIAPRPAYGSSSEYVYSMYELVEAVEAVDAVEAVEALPSAGRRLDLGGEEHHPVCDEHALVTAILVELSGVERDDIRLNLDSAGLQIVIRVPAEVNTTAVRADIEAIDWSILSTQYGHAVSLVTDVVVGDDLVQLPFAPPPSLPQSLPVQPPPPSSPPLLPPLSPPPPPPSQPLSPPSPPASPSVLLCSDECTTWTDSGEIDLTHDGLCDDGLDASRTSMCILGTDCSDCGPRTVPVSPSSPPPPASPPSEGL